MSEDTARKILGTVISVVISIIFIILSGTDFERFVRFALCHIITLLWIIAMRQG